MSNILKIYKDDGSIQCHPEIRPRLVEDDRQYLESIKVNIIGSGRHEHLPIIVPAVCGAATGWANVFEIDGQRISRTQLFELARNGFRVWHFEGIDEVSFARGDEDPFPLAFSVAAKMLGHNHPDRLIETIGYAVRVYKIGDPTTDDYQANRINLETNSQHQILRYWFG